MKKLIFSVSLVLMSLNIHPQAGTFGTNTAPQDPSNNPSGVGFGGALGGAITTPGSSTPTTTAPIDSTIPSSPAYPQEQQEDFGMPRVPTPENNQERGNFTGGSLGGETDSNITPVQPTWPSNIPPGTGAPTSY